MPIVRPIPIRAARVAALTATALAGLHLLVSCGEAEALTKDPVFDVEPEDPAVCVVEVPEAGSGGSLSVEVFDEAPGLLLLPEERAPLVTEPISNRRHPYVLLGATDLAEIRTTGTKRNEIFQVIKAAVDANGSSCLYQGLSAYAMCYAVTGNTKYAASVHQQLNALASRDEWDSGFRWKPSAMRLGQYAMAYDLCYDYLKSRSSFKKIQNKLAFETSKLAEAAVGPYKEEWKNFWSHAYAQGHCARALAGLTYGALALKFEGNELTNFSQADVDEWIDIVKESWTKVYYCLIDNEDGTWYEGSFYEKTFIGQNFPNSAYILKRVEGYDLITQNPWFHRLSTFWIYNSKPESPASRVMVWGDMGASWPQTNALLGPLRMCARLFKDSYAQWGADLIAAKGRQTHMTGLLFLHEIVNELVYYDSSVKPRSPEGDLKTAWLGEDLGLALMRTGWGNGDLNAGMICGAYGGRSFFEIAKANSVWRDGRWHNANYPLGGSKGRFPQDIVFNPGHAHPENNSFTISKNGVYLAVKRAGKGEAGGTIWGRLTDATNTITVDGRGQISEGREVNPYYGADREDFYKSDGSISSFSPTANYDLTVGDATRCYPRKLGLKEFRRHFFFLKPDYFVVFDTLDSAQSKRYDWYCHFTDPVSFDGRWILGKAEQGNALGVYVASPASYSRDSGSHGSHYYYDYLAEDSEMNFVRLTTQAQGPKRFITVLYPTTLGEWGDRPTVEKISENSSAAGVRVKHANGGEDVILCAYHADSSVTVGSFSVDALGAAVRKNELGELTSIYLANGKSLKDNNRLLVRISRDATSFEASFRGQQVDVTGKNIAGFRLYAPDASQLSINGNDVAFTRDGDWIETE